MHLATLHPAGGVAVDEVLGNNLKILVLCMLQRYCREENREWRGGEGGSIVWEKGERGGSGIWT